MEYVMRVSDPITAPILQHALRHRFSAQCAEKGEDQSPQHQGRD
jgi:hypothetical protein